MLKGYRLLYFYSILVFPASVMSLSKLHPLLKPLQKDHKIAPNSNLIIDAKTFYKVTYIDSGCEYILGGEYDRYAEHLRKILKNFLDNNVTCYVVFGGAADSDIHRRLYIHQKIIDQTSYIDPTNPDNAFSEPIYTKEVFKEVLNELGILYATCEKDHPEDAISMVNLAKFYNCPILTRSFEYSLLGVACVSPRSLIFADGRICSKIFDPDVCKGRIGLPHDKLALFLVLIAERNGDYLQDLKRLITFRENNMLYVVNRYLRQRPTDVLFSVFKKEMDQIKYEIFLRDYYQMRDFMYSRHNSLIQKYFQKIDMLSEDWFVSGIINDRIAPCYVNLRKSGIFSGSWLISDNNRDDSMLPSMNIVRFAYELLTDFRGANITFIGRVGAQSKAWEIFDSMGYERAQGNVGDIFKEGCSKGQLPDYFTYFIEVELPGFNFYTLEMIPDDCKMLMIALVYYLVKIGGDNLALVYSVLLSYTMLGPVARTTGLLKRSNFNLMQDNNIHGDAKTGDGLETADCFVAARGLIDYFYCNDLAEKFNREVLHMKAEFENCLQQLNYLNRLCGERVQCTVYHRCYNATFIYNVFLEINVKQPMAVVQRMLTDSPTVLKYFQQLLQAFEGCVEPLTRS